MSGQVWLCMFHEGNKYNNYYQPPDLSPSLVFVNHFNKKPAIAPSANKSKNNCSSRPTLDPSASL
ncbi:hypothetical protein J6590_084598 [Homalodisca vitripennis]|nr:hypothetical protein J6590_084598 [Homalodisca vitripennis]